KIGIDRSTIVSGSRPIPARIFEQNGSYDIFLNPPPLRSKRIAVIPRSYPAFKRARLFSLISDALRLPNIESTSSHRSVGCESSISRNSADSEMLHVRSGFL